MRRWMEPQNAGMEGTSDRKGVRNYSTHEWEEHQNTGMQEHRNEKNSRTKGWRNAGTQKWRNARTVGKKPVVRI